MIVNSSARRLATIADDILGYCLIDQLRESSGDYTEVAQIGFLVNCLALAEYAEQSLGMEPEICAGPSFGAKAAVVYVGALPVEDAIKMTAQLARCAVDYFSRNHRDVVTHSFVRAPEDRLREILAELDLRGEWHDISCHIDHDFYMLSLRERNLDWLQQRLRRIGALPLYTMRPPMHSAAFGELRDKAEEEVLGGLQFAEPRIPVIADHDGTIVTSADGIRSLLLDGFVKPLRWPLVVKTMKRLGIAKAYISGPDSLFGRVRCTTSNFDVVTVNPRSVIRPRDRGDVAGD